MAQTKRSFTLEDIMWGGKDFWSHRPAGHFSTFWGDRMVELSVEEVKTLSDAKGRLGKASTLFTLADVNAIRPNSPKQARLWHCCRLQRPTCFTTGRPSKSCGKDRASAVAVITTSLMHHGVRLS